MPKKNRIQIIGGAQLLLILAALVILGMYLHGLLGALALVLVFFGALFVASQYLIPLHGMVGRSTAFYSLLTFLFRLRLPHVIVEEGRIKSNPTDPMILAGGPGILEVGKDSAAVTESTIGPEVYGPGKYAIADRKEKLKQAIDLRPQSRTDQTDAMTSDGVKIRLPFKVDFQIDGRGHTPSPSQPFPFDRAAVLQATYDSTQIAPQGPQTWHERVPAIVSGALQDYIATQRLIDLITPTAAVPNPRQHLGRQALNGSRAPASRIGARLISVSVEPFTIPDENVRREFDGWRTRSWQADVQLSETGSTVVRIWDVTRALRSAGLDPQTIREVLVMLFSPQGKNAK
jgi:hypothetical protein